MIRIKFDRQAFRRDAAKAERDLIRELERVMDQVGRRIVKKLQGYTDEEVSPKPVTPEEAARIRERIEDRFANGLASKDPKAVESTRKLIERKTRARIAKRRTPPTAEEVRKIRARYTERYGKGLNSKDKYHRKAVRSHVEMLIRSDLGRLKRQRAKAAERPRHPGHWGDKTEELMQSYGHTVERRGPIIHLTVFNEAAYAQIVEAKSGYFVVEGTLDSGPVKQALKDVIKDMRLGWRVR